MFDALRSHGLQHTRPPWPPPSPRSLFKFMPIKLVMLCFYTFYMFFSKLETSSFLRNSKFIDYSQSTPSPWSLFKFMSIKLLMLCFYMFYMFFSNLENSSFLRNSKFTDYSQSTPTISTHACSFTFYQLADSDEGNYFSLWSWFNCWAGLYFKAEFRSVIAF